MSVLATPIEQNVTGQGNIFFGTGNVYVTQNPQPLPLAETRTRADLRILLNRVKTFWIEGVLETSFHKAVLIELGKAMQPGAVERPWDSVLELPDSKSQTLSRNAEIVNIFDQANRALLILGEPGSGKTYSLLELARDLIARAENDREFDQPVPVIFNLSSWASKRQSLLDWMVEELLAKYQIPRKISRQWLQEYRLLPLLDGLDEVKPESRVACVEAINDFGKEIGLTGLVVCCRREEYARLHVRLKLNAAIYLESLTTDQVDGYLAKLSPKLEALRTTLQQDETLMTLAQSPLMLSVMSLAYQDASVEAIVGKTGGSVDEYRRHLFDTYIERMFARKGQSNQPYSPLQTKKWLAWLAQKMTQHGQTLFLIEQLQPSWLSTRGQRWAFVFSSRLLDGLSAGLIIGLSAGLERRAD